MAANNVPLSDIYCGKKTINAQFGSAFSKNLVSVVNNNIKMNTSESTRGKMHPAMINDLHRMKYYVDGKAVSAPGNMDKSLANFNNITHSDASLAWLPQYIDSLSAFLHQGIFVDIFESVPTWQDEQGKSWDIQMISLDSQKTSNSFYINRHGVIKVIVQSGVSNLILKSGEIIKADSKDSHLQMQLTLSTLKNADGSFIVSDALNKADHAVLTVNCQDIM
ncbi:hypothetical protein J2X14_001924 [Pantoea alhagi]|uniref:hypothetical protein n=1 Tax=Mixta sp. BE291 TaxID=3158787 RepID=UPI0028628768|nr:hypothetical protein [Pantoea alhagi]